MKISEELLLELLLVSRLYLHIPFNSIHQFVVMEEYRTGRYFFDKVYNHMYNRCSPKVDKLLDEIKKEIME